MKAKYLFNFLMSETVTSRFDLAQAHSEIQRLLTRPTVSSPPGALLSKRQSSTPAAHDEIALTFLWAHQHLPETEETRLNLHASTTRTSNYILQNLWNIITCPLVIMGAKASLITSLTSVYSIVHSCADQRKHQSSASLAFVRGIHRRPVNSLHKWPVTRKMFPFDDVIMPVCPWSCFWPLSLQALLCETVLGLRVWA